MARLSRLLYGTLAVTILLQAPAYVFADSPDAGERAKQISALVDRAAAFLKTRQGANGSFSPQRSGPGITALVAAALIRNGRADDPIVANAMNYLEGSVKKDGGIYDRGLANYTTSVALVAFKE